jgi:hypothetical protein
MAITKRGKATVEGIPGSIDLIVYPVKQSGKGTMNFDEEIIKDEHGLSVAWLARDTHYLMDFAFKLLGDTQTHALSGGVFLQPYATVTLSGFDLPAFNGTYQNISGQEIDLGNTKVGDLNTKFRRYDDPTQNTLSQTVPQ